MEFAARNMKITLPADHAVDAEIDLGPEGGAFSLAARLYVSLPGMERATAQRLVEATHQVCPYSRATHGNIAVETNAHSVGSAEAITPDIFQFAVGVEAQNARLRLVENHHIAVWEGRDTVSASV